MSQLALPVVHRQTALAVFMRDETYLVSEIVDPFDGRVFHRPPGGGLESGETAEQALRREIDEELGISLSAVRELGAIDHVWIWKRRELRERAFFFLADPADDPRLARGECPVLVEADGLRFQMRWRPIAADPAGLPPLSPAALIDLVAGAKPR